MAKASMIPLKYLSMCIIFCTYCTISKLSNDQSANTIRGKREISPVSEKTFKKQKVSSASFTRVGSTRLDTKTWPKLVPIMFVSFIL